MPKSIIKKCPQCGRTLPCRQDAEGLCTACHTADYRLRVRLRIGHKKQDDHWQTGLREILAGVDVTQWLSPSTIKALKERRNAN